MVETTGRMGSRVAKLPEATFPLVHSLVIRPPPALTKLMSAVCAARDMSPEFQLLLGISSTTSMPVSSVAENELNCLPTVTVNPPFCSTVWVWVSNVPLPVESSYTVWALNSMGMSKASNRPNKRRVFMGPMG